MKKQFLLFLLLTSLRLYAYNGSGSITSGGITRTFVFHSPGTSMLQIYRWY